MKPQRFHIDGKVYDVRALRVGDDLWLHTDGETWVVNLRPKSKSAKDGDKSAASSGEVHAPMPGKILKVNIKPGDKVKMKQIVIIMDAMKMEYSLAAPISGVIKSLNVKENQQVELDQVLAVITPEGASQVKTK